ncbi:WxL protein host-binding domain-containing protein, partial [Salmonella enterica]
QVNYRNVINANLQNPMAGYLNQMYVQAEVKGLSNSKLSYKANKEMLQMAPNSNFDYPVSIGDGNKLEAGKYRLSMTVYG